MAQPVKHRKIENPAKRLKDIQRRYSAAFSSLRTSRLFVRCGVRAHLDPKLKGHLKHQNATVVSWTSVPIIQVYPTTRCTRSGARYWDVVHLLQTADKVNYQWSAFAARGTNEPRLANIFLASIYAPSVLQANVKGYCIVGSMTFSLPVRKTADDRGVRSVLAKNGLKVSRKK